MKDCNGNKIIQENTESLSLFTSEEILGYDKIRKRNKKKIVLRYFLVAIVSSKGVVYVGITENGKNPNLQILVQKQNHNHFPCLIKWADDFPTLIVAWDNGFIDVICFYFDDDSEEFSFISDRSKAHESPVEFASLFTNNEEVLVSTFDKLGVISSHRIAMGVETLGLILVSTIHTGVKFEGIYLLRDCKLDSDQNKIEDFQCTLTCSNQNIGIYNGKSFKNLASINEKIIKINFLTNNKNLISIDEKFNFILYSLHNNAGSIQIKWLKTEKPCVKPSKPISYTSFTNIDSNIIVSTFENRDVMLFWDYSNIAIISSFILRLPESDKDKKMLSISFNKNSKVLTVLLDNGEILMLKEFYKHNSLKKGVFELNSTYATLNVILIPPPQNLKELSFSIDGKFLICSEESCKINVLELDNSFKKKYDHPIAVIQMNSYQFLAYNLSTNMAVKNKAVSLIQLNLETPSCDFAITTPYCVIWDIKNIHIFMFPDEFIYNGKTGNFKRISSIKLKNSILFLDIIVLKSREVNILTSDETTIRTVDKNGNLIKEFDPRIFKNNKITSLSVDYGYISCVLDYYWLRVWRIFDNKWQCLVSQRECFIGKRIKVTIYSCRCNFSGNFVSMCGQIKSESSNECKEILVYNIKTDALKRYSLSYGVYHCSFHVWSPTISNLLLCNFDCDFKVYCAEEFKTRSNYKATCEAIFISEDLEFLKLVRE